MIAYKGFNIQLESVKGNGRKETCSFEPGKKYIEQSSKTARSGYHCCENPFECLTYYQLDGKNRFFQVLAEGDINEDENERIACTELTLVKELGIAEFALRGMEYMIMHPSREKWQQNHMNVCVEKDKAEATTYGAIAIARGPHPIVKGVPGSILGLIIEPVLGKITEAKLFRSSCDSWMELTDQRELREVVQDEEKTH